MNNPVNLVDPSGLCGVSEPWNSPDDGLSWLWDYSTASPTSGAQVADLIPLHEICSPIAATGPTGITIVAYCDLSETAVGLAAAYATQVQIANSDCSTLRTLGATFLNLWNLTLDVPGGLVAEESVELGIYYLGGQLIACGEAPPGGSSRAKRW
jgi:hypothetical protein